MEQRNPGGMTDRPEYIFSNFSRATDTSQQIGTWVLTRFSSVRYSIWQPVRIYPHRRFQPVIPAR